MRSCDVIVLGQMVSLVGLRTQTQNAAFLERKGPEERKPCAREASKTQEKIAMRFLNASVLERKSLNRNLSWGFPLANSSLKHAFQNPVF